MFVTLCDALIDGFSDPMVYEVWLEVQSDLLNVSNLMFNYEDKDERLSSAYKLFYEAITADDDYDLDESNPVEELAIKLITSFSIEQFIRHFYLMQMFDCVYEDEMTIEEARVAVEEWFDEDDNRLFFDLEGNKLWLHPNGDINSKKPKRKKRK